MSIVLHPQRRDRPIATQLIQVPAVLADGQIEVARAHGRCDAVRVERPKCAVRAHGESGDRPSVGVRRVDEAAVLCHCGPARRGLVRRHGATDEHRRAARADDVGRHTAASGLGNEQLVAQAKREPEWLDPSGRLECRGTRHAVGSDGVDVERIGVLLSHDQPASVRTEGHLRGADVRATQRTDGSRNGRRPAPVVERESGDVAAAAAVQDIQQVAVNRQADRQRPVRRNPTRQHESRRRHPKDRDVVAAGVDGEQPTPIVAQCQRALRSQSASCSCATGRHRAHRGERAVGGALEDRDSIPRNLVHEGVYRALSAVHGLHARRECDSTRCGRAGNATFLRASGETRQDRQSDLLLHGRELRESEERVLLSRQVRSDRGHGMHAGTFMRRFSRSSHLMALALDAVGAAA